MSKYGAALDACVLAPMPLVDTLLRFAEEGFYCPFWSDRTLDETIQAIERIGHVREDAEWRVGLMRAHFPDALVRYADDIKFFPSLPDPDDEHVLAAAVKSDAQAIITLNLRDFPAEICARHDIDVIHPDEFLADHFDLAPDVACDLVLQQVQDLQNPVIPVQMLLAGLRRDAPAFSNLVESELRRRGDI